jgi:mono/diheme cytochrome c family protein
VGSGRKTLTVAALAAGAVALTAFLSAIAEGSGGAHTRAASIISDRCTVCHGDNGDGQGPSAATMNPRPINFHDPKWQKSVSDQTIAKAVMYGGTAVGVSAAMPANPDLVSQPDVVAAIVKQIRAWGK